MRWLRKAVLVGSSGVVALGAGALVAVTPAHAATGTPPAPVFSAGPGTKAPPDTLGPYAMTAFATASDTTAIGTAESSLPAPGGASLGLSPALVHDQIGDGWYSWSNTYQGNVYYESSANGDSATITLPAGTTAFAFYAEPSRIADTEDIEATANGVTTSPPDSIGGARSATYFGFYAPAGGTLSTITVTDETAGTDGFGIGEMQIAIPEPTVTRVSSLDPTALHATTVLTASVAGVPTSGVIDTAAIPTGTVQFRDGATPIGPPEPVNAQGQASYAALLPSGDSAVSAVYAGDGQHLGSTSAPITEQVVPAIPAAGNHVASTPNAGGWWVLGANGSVSAFGTAHNYGSIVSEHIHLAAPVVGIAATPDGGGYWIVAADGGVFSFGDARFHGSTGNLKLNKPMVGMAPSPDGGGYWLVASDGGVFTFGDATFYGSLGDVHLVEPILGMSPLPNGTGYWLVASDGGVFTFGHARFYGSAAEVHKAAPVVGMTRSVDGAGYWLVGADGGIYTFGDARYYGSGAGHLAAPGVGLVVPVTGGYRVIESTGAPYTLYP